MKQIRHPAKMSDLEVSSRAATKALSSAAPRYRDKTHDGIIPRIFNYLNNGISNKLTRLFFKIISANSPGIDHSAVTASTSKWTTSELLTTSRIWQGCVVRFKHIPIGGLYVNKWFKPLCYHASILNYKVCPCSETVFMSVKATFAFAITPPPFFANCSNDIPQHWSTSVIPNQRMNDFTIRVSMGQR